MAREDKGKLGIVSPKFRYALAPFALLAALAPMAAMPETHHAMPYRTATENTVRSYVYAMCIMSTAFDPPDTVENFKAQWLRQLKAPVPVEDLLTYSECEPNYLGKPTDAPLSFITAENSTDRLLVLVALREILVEDRHRPDIWLAVINATNMQGMTALDYVEYMIANHRALPDEAPGLERYIDFMCANGAVYAKSRRACPNPAAKAFTDTAAGIEQRIRAR